MAFTAMTARIKAQAKKPTSKSSTPSSKTSTKTTKTTTKNTSSARKDGGGAKYFIDVSGANNLTPSQKQKVQSNTKPARVVITASTPSDLAKKLVSSSAERQKLINIAQSAGGQIEVNKDTAEAIIQILEKTTLEDSAKGIIADDLGINDTQVKELQKQAEEGAKGFMETIKQGALQIEQAITSNLIPVIAAAVLLIVLVVILTTKKGKKIAATVTAAVTGDKK